MAAALLLMGWASWLVGILGRGSEQVGEIFVSSLGGAFVLGISSFERLGGISALLAALSLILFLVEASRISD